MTNGCAPTEDAGLNQYSGRALTWAGLGVGVLALQAYVYAAWLVSGDARPVDPGPDPVPTSTEITLAVVQVVCVLILVGVVAVFVVRPRRRTGRYGVDAAFVLAWATIYFHDPIINFTEVRVLYNAAALNLGSWGAQIPGWGSPRGENLPEPLLVFLPAYAGVCFLLTLAGARLATVLRERWQLASWWTVFILVWVAQAALNLLIETAWMQTDLWVYPGAARNLSIFAGTSSQFPIYESVFFGAFVAVMSVLRARTTCATTVARNVPTWHRAVPVLALIGVANTAVVLTYDLPNQLVVHLEQEYPHDLPSYQETGLCDPRPGDAC